MKKILYNLNGSIKHRHLSWIKNVNGLNLINLNIWFIWQYLSKLQATVYERELLIYNVTSISCNWTWHVISTPLQKRSKLTTNDFKIILSSKTKSGSVNVVFYNLVGPMLIEGWFGNRWIATGTTLCCFPNPFFALSISIQKLAADDFLPRSSTLRTPGSLEVLDSLCQRGRRDLFCTWGVFGVQLVFFKRDADTDVVHVQRSWSHLLSRWHLRLTGGAYRNPDVHVPGWVQPREKVHRKRSLGGWWYSVAEK